MAVCGVCLNFRGKGTEVLKHGKSCLNPAWKKIEELKRHRSGYDAANKLFQKLFGINDPMDPEDKAKLKKWREDHKEEIAERRKAESDYAKAHGMTLKQVREMKRSTRGR